MKVCKVHNYLVQRVNSYLQGSDGNVCEGDAKKVNVCKVHLCTKSIMLSCEVCRKVMIELTLMRCAMEIKLNCDTFSSLVSFYSERTKETSRVLKVRVRM